MRPAAFLDRDGTIIADAHYLADASRVHAMPGAAEALRRLHARGVVLVIVTNQSGIAQRLITAAQYDAVRRRVESLFALEGAPIAGSWHCPHYPSISGPCECRKPLTGMYRDAAKALDLAMDRSLYVGDRRRDVEPSLTLGGYGVLVPAPDTPEADVIWARGHADIADSLEEAAQRYLDWLDRS
ncbi:MAG: HAD-IIIA family hydrolase [Gemmatimonadaceae bacterium]|nr:HAD-IIIA family hydrolase [Gemmatimonadaceae bacterium]